MRMIRVGDEVQAFLDARIRGVVVSMEEGKAAPWMQGGTAAREIMCVIKLHSGATVKYKRSELHHAN